MAIDCDERAKWPYSLGKHDVSKWYILMPPPVRAVWLAALTHSLARLLLVNTRRLHGVHVLEYCQRQGQRLKPATPTLIISQTTATVTVTLDSVLLMGWTPTHPARRLTTSTGNCQRHAAELKYTIELFADHHQHQTGGNKHLTTLQVTD